MGLKEAAHGAAAVEGRARPAFRRRTPVLLRSRGEAGFHFLWHTPSKCCRRAAALGRAGLWRLHGLAGRDAAHSFTVMVSTNALLSGFFAEMSAASWLMKDLLPPLVAGALAIRSLEANRRWLGAAYFANACSA